MGRRQDAVVVRMLLPFVRPYRTRLLLAMLSASVGPILLAARIWLLKILIDDALRQHRPTLVLLVAAAFVAIAIGRGLLGGWSAHLSGTVGALMVRDLRTRTFDALQALSLRYFHCQRLGDLLTRLTVDIGAVEEVLVSGLPTLVTNAVTVVLFSALLVALDPALVLVALTIVPVLALCAVADARLGRRAQQQIRDSTSELTSTAEEGLSAIAAVKAFARGPYESHRYTQTAQRSALARLRAVRLRAVFPPLVELTAALGTAAVVWIGGTQVLAGRLSLGSLVVFLSYLGSLYSPIQGLGRLAGSTQRALVGASRVADILTAPAHLIERVGGQPMPEGPGAVDFRAVSFGYGQGPPVLDCVSFRIEPGQIVALVGSSGAGKTTLVSLLLSFYDPDEGDILIDGHPLRAVGVEHARARVAAVLQEPMLFDATIADNIRYGRLDATDQQIWHAAALADVDEFAAALPDGYATRIGPRGARLSGGQRQRVAIARAFLKEAPVLVLDEATSALDPATETRVLSAIRVLSKQRSVLLVAHRPSTITQADQVIVLEHGRIVQTGTPADLTSHAGPFTDLIQARPVPISLGRNDST